MKTLCLSLTVLLFSLLLSCSESSEKYNTRAFQLADSVFSFADLNFTLASDCQSMWRSVIFDHQYISPLFHTTSYCSDFNEGIAKYKVDMKDFEKIMIKKKKYIDSVYSTLKDGPSKSEKIFDNIKELVSVYDRSYEMALKPEGSLNEYTENLNTLYSKFKEIKSKIELDKK